MKQVLKKERPNPPGTVHLSKNLYVDKYEVTVGQWKEFQNWALNEDASDFDATSLYPDTLVWLDVPGGTGYVNSGIYFSYEGFDNHPIVGLTHEQAVLYCQWKTDRVNEMIRSGKANPEWKFKMVKYRLPTKQEWELAAAGKLDPEMYPFGLEREKEDIGDMIGYRWPKYDKPGFEHRIYTKEVDVLWPNGYGAHHMTGNVSEMIDHKGISKGGHFNWPLDSCRISLDHRYTNPEAWLGFRAVCEVVE